MKVNFYKGVILAILPTIFYQTLRYDKKIIHNFQFRFLTYMISVDYPTNPLSY